MKFSSAELAEFSKLRNQKDILLEKYLDAQLTSTVATQLQDSLNDLEENYAN